MFFAVFASITISNAKVSKFLISPDSISDKLIRTFFYRFHKQNRRGKIAYLSRFIPALTSPGFYVFYRVDLYIQKNSIADGNLHILYCMFYFPLYRGGNDTVWNEIFSEQVYRECFQNKYQQKIYLCLDD
jgi:hypothetical protein